MLPFEIVAHRGLHDEEPENTLAAFERAVELGADAVELDVRLTSDHVPVVFHYVYLDHLTSASGAIFDHTYQELQDVRFVRALGERSEVHRISTLEEVLDAIGGRIGQEIEIKGPEPEAAVIIAKVLRRFEHLWAEIEVTSYEPMLLWRLRQRCPDVPTDLLLPRSEAWMRPDVVAHMAIHRSRLAGARAVHLHPTQLSSEVVAALRARGIDVHAWDVNDEQSLRLAARLAIPRICTDNPRQALDFGRRLT